MKNKYRLSIFRNGQTARVIAIGNDDSHFMLGKNSENKNELVETRAIKFHHNGVTSALKPYTYQANDVFSHEDTTLSDEDYFVEFESSTTLHDFYWSLSPYDDFFSSKKFSYAHNCSDAAHVALTKLDLIDVYLMESPTKVNEYLNSTPFKLYLYKEKEKIFFLMHEEPCFLPDPCWQLAKDWRFEALPHKLIKCSHQQFTQAVVDFTAQAGYTSTQFKVNFKKTFNRYNEETFCRIPWVSTPYELFCHAKEFKIKQLELQRMPFQLELAKKALQFRMRMHPTEMPVAKVEEIISETDKRLKQSSHHAEFYLKLLINTNDVIIHALKQQTASVDLYKQAANFFKNREPSKVKRDMDRVIMVNTLVYIGLFIGLNYASYQANQYFFKDYSLLWRVPSHLFFNTVGSNLVAALVNYVNKHFSANGMAKAEKAIAQEIIDCQTAVETPLSKAITDLADGLVYRRP